MLFQTPWRQLISSIDHPYQVTNTQSHEIDYAVSHTIPQHLALTQTTNYADSLEKLLALFKNARINLNYFSCVNNPTNIYKFKLLSK